MTKINTRLVQYSNYSLFNHHKKVTKCNIEKHETKKRYLSYHMNICNIMIKKKYEYVSKKITPCVTLMKDVENYTLIKNALQKQFDELDNIDS